MVDDKRLKITQISAIAPSFYENVVEGLVPGNSFSQEPHENVSVKKEAPACHYDYNFLQLDH